MTHYLMNDHICMQWQWPFLLKYINIGLTKSPYRESRGSNLWNPLIFQFNGHQYKITDVVNCAVIIWAALIFWEKNYCRSVRKYLSSYLKKFLKFISLIFSNWMYMVALQGNFMRKNKFHDKWIWTLWLIYLETNWNGSILCTKPFTNCKARSMPYSSG